MKLTLVERLHGFRLIIFDMDGTLVDSQHHIVSAMGEAFGGVGLPPPDGEAVRQIVGLTLEDAFLRLAPADTPLSVHQELQVLFKRAAIAQRDVPGYQEPLYEGAREIIHQLDLPDVCLGIATGRPRRGVDFSLALHKLENRFVTIQTVDSNPGKPHPGMVQQAMAETGADPEETVVIGDTSYDMMMARAAGAAAIGVTWGYHAEEALLSAGAQALAREMAALPAILAGFRRIGSCA
ncbi:HAD-IA family hydrolase [Limibacillus halophilus]|uniref:Phosphoglycolate phosphatase n=1 Tax=Limibacillus halophilus TaxID=1579333 RepID=A0A839SUJ9_9PROT|nr:HAD-IA family hydrolase [Limibacillus halophilus]MBB3065689.1 phosphoglycolate phosphatase [Limibacillus halophilus]